MSYWLIKNFPTDNNPYCWKLNPKGDSKKHDLINEFQSFGPTEEPTPLQVKLANQLTPKDSGGIFDTWGRSIKLKRLEGLINVVGGKMKSGWPAKCYKAIQDKKEIENKNK